MKLLCLFLTAFTPILALKDPISPIHTVPLFKNLKDSVPHDLQLPRDIECDPTYKYRSIDGSCNNLEHPTWGMNSAPFLRLFEPRYSDGKELPPVAEDGSELPNPRKLVTSLFSDQDVPDTVSLIVAQWAQFIAHDFAVGVNKEGVDDCCASDDALICLPIKIPEDDAWFTQFNVSCLALTRTQTVICDGCDPEGPKIQINGVTHGLDASQVYGSDVETSESLREFKDGKMVMRTLADGRCFLPSKGTCYNSDVCYLAGEKRVNQNTQLTVMHTLLVREHNRVVEALALVNPDWDDETLYQEARSIVIAEYLHITFNGFLPNILHVDQMTKAKLWSNTKGYTEYDPDLPNTVIVSFSNPTFRIFHSGLQGIIALHNYHLDPTSYINLTDYMNSPGILEEENKFDELILGVITQPMQTIDSFYTSQIEEKLFHFGKPYGTDLNSIDIQRARDHGVPGYPTVLYGCTGAQIKDFDDLADFWPADKIEIVRQLYTSVNDIDLFVAINFETKQEGHRFGPILECIVAEQFYRWKYGDRFWYEIGQQPHSFTPEQLEEIKKTSLSRLICDTSDNIVNITTTAWMPPGDENPIISCEDVDSVDLSKWTKQ